MVESVKYRAFGGTLYLLDIYTIYKLSQKRASPYCNAFDSMFCNPLLDFWTDVLTVDIVRQETAAFLDLSVPIERPERCSCTGLPCMVSWSDA